MVVQVQRVLPADPPPQLLVEPPPVVVPPGMKYSALAAAMAEAVKARDLHLKTWREWWAGSKAAVPTPAPATR